MKKLFTLPLETTRHSWRGDGEQCVALTAQGRGPTSGRSLELQYFASVSDEFTAQTHFASRLCIWTVMLLALHVCVGHWQRFRVKNERLILHQLMIRRQNNKTGRLLDSTRWWASDQRSWGIVDAAPVCSWPSTTATVFWLLSYRFSSDPHTPRCVPASLTHSRQHTCKQTK